jgi:predicted site-specific integrase-resolvase
MTNQNGRVEISGRVYVTPRFFADKLGVSLTSIGRYQKQGLLPPSIKLGRLRFFEEEMVTTYLISQNESNQSSLI